MVVVVEVGFGGEQRGSLRDLQTGKQIRRGQLHPGRRRHDGIHRPGVDNQTRGSVGLGGTEEAVDTFRGSRETDHTQICHTRHNLRIVVRGPDEESRRRGLLLLGGAEKVRVRLGVATGYLRWQYVEQVHAPRLARQGDRVGGQRLGVGCKGIARGKEIVVVSSGKEVVARDRPERRCKATDITPRARLNVRHGAESTYRIHIMDIGYISGLRRRRHG